MTFLTGMFFVALFVMSSVMTILFYLISLRKLSSKIKNYASLFTGIDLLLVSAFVGVYSVKSLSVIIGIFISAFALVKIIRKMD
jgi:hypothetical protein